MELPKKTEGTLTIGSSVSLFSALLAVPCDILDAAYLFSVLNLIRAQIETLPHRTEVLNIETHIR